MERGKDSAPEEEGGLFPNLTGVQPRSQSVRSPTEPLLINIKYVNVWLVL